MSTIQNYRDQQLQATTPRILAVGSDYINLTSSYQYFKVTAGGVASPTSINVTASLVGNLTGTVTFTVESGTATISQTGNVCTLDYANMTTDTVTIKASLTYLTLVYEARTTLTKVKDGIAGVNASVLTLLSTAQAVTFDGSGTAAPTSQTITFTAALQNLTGTATFTATAYNISGTSLGTITLGGTGNTRTLTNAQFTSLAGTDRVVVSATLSGYSDTITVVRLDDGTNALVGYLTNESVTLAADASGTVVSLAPASGNFKVYSGLTDVSASATYSVVSNTGCVVAIDTTGAYSVSSMSTDTAYATLQATYSSINIQKVLSLSKSKTGAAGVSPTVYSIELSSPVITKDVQDAATTGNYSSIAIQGKKYVGNTLTNFGWITVTPNNGTETTPRVDTANAAYSLAPATTSGVSSYVVKLYDALTAGNLLDTQTVPVVFKGNTGAAGATAKYCDLTISTQAITYDTSGNTPSPTTTTLTATAYNTSGTVYYDFLIGGTSVQNTTTNTYAYTVPTTYASMPKQVVVNVREGSSNGTIVASDTLSIIGIKPGLVGSNGTDSIQVILSNEAQALPAGNNGTVSSYANSGTDIKVYQGTTLLDYDGIGTSAGKWTVTKAGTNITPGPTTSVGTSPNRYVTIGIHSGVSVATDTSVVTYTITGVASNGAAFSINKTQTFSKVRAGTDAIVAILSNEAHVFPADNTGAVTSYTNSGTTIYVYEGTTQLSYDGVGTANSSWTVASTATNITRGTITDSGAYATVGTHSGVSAATDTSIITYNISGKNSNGVAFTISKTQTFTKSKTGATGTGTPGAAGDSARRCYQKTTLSSLGTGSVTTAGSTSYPTAAQSSTAWGLNSAWVATPPTLAAGEILYQSDGIYSAATSNTTWNRPYMSSLKVGSLDALTTNTGNLTVSGSIKASTAVVSGTTMTGAGLAVNSTGTFALGNASTNLSFNGTTLTLNGQIVLNGNLSTNAVSTIKIQNNAVTVPSYFEEPGEIYDIGNTPVSVVQGVVTTSGSQPIVININSGVAGAARNGAAYANTTISDVTTKIYIVNTTSNLVIAIKIINQAVSVLNALMGNISGSCVFTPIEVPAGTYYFKFMMECPSVIDGVAIKGIFSRHPCMTILETKK